MLLGIELILIVGMSLDISGLKKIGRPAVMMCFVPVSFELAGMLLIAPRLLGLSMLEAAIMGAVLAAVSPGGSCSTYGEINGGRIWHKERYSAADPGGSVR